MSTSLALSFRAVQFDVIDRSGQPWLRSQQISVALGYSRGDQAADLYARNADEFTDAMTAVIQLPDLQQRNSGAGQMREVRIFSLRGCHLLGMFARTKIAKEFRKWVLDILDREANPFTLSPPNPAFRPEKTRKALPGGLTIEQQDAVKALVKSRVEALPQDAQAKGAITCWAAIKSKFGVTYKEVPAANFAEVLSLVARLALPHEPQALPPIHFPAVTAMPKWDPNHMNSYGQLHLSAKNTFFNPDWSDPEWLLLKLLQERGIDVNGPLISYQLKMNLIRFYEMELPDFLTNIIPSLIRGKGMFWDDENWSPRH